MKQAEIKYHVSKYPSANLLPAEWDQLAESGFQKKRFLEHGDTYNPCKQRYYLAYSGTAAVAAALVYTLPVNLLSFAAIRSPLRMQVIGLPASVSAPGIFGDCKAVEFLIGYLLQAEKGLLLGLNLPPAIETGKAVKMQMLPAIEIVRHFDDWEQYLDQLRSSYRRRCLHILDKWENIRSGQTPCSAFTENHYRLYLAVINRSTTKLETLQQAYFHQLPPEFYLTTYYREDEIICWHINCRDEAMNRMYFFFGGHDYRFIHRYDSYFNNLLGILRESIGQGFGKVDLGQTAEIPKLKLGGTLVPKVLFVYHRNPLWLFFLRAFKKWLGYQRRLPETHVFRTDFQPELKKITV